MHLSSFRPAFRPFGAVASLFRTPATQCTATRIPASTSSFSSTARLEKRSKKVMKDPRISTSHSKKPPATPFRISIASGFVEDRALEQD
jgi:large subunit ribosomal protein L40